MDISMPNINGIEATRRILVEAPETRIIALSIHAKKRFVDEMLRAGARAYILKDSVPEELVRAIHSVMRGESFLSAPILGTVVSGYREPTDEAPEDSAASDPILQTKLHRPSPPPDLVPRTRVLERLEAGRVRPLTLVSAPAGYGKSILISSWLETCGDWPSAWFSLDGDDSNLRQFLSYFVAAVQSAFPQTCEQTQSLISAPQLPPLATLVVSLGNDLDAIDRPFILVLDDYHRIDAGSPVNDLLHQLLAHPPIPLHLIILSRWDPPLQLLTLRARGQMTEVRMQDLRFDREESRALLENILGFNIGDDALTNLQQEMEGWVVGLRLVSLALRRLKNRDGFLKNLHGGIQQTQEYLTREVIAQQSPLMQDWLVKSAILNRFCEPLVQAVCAAETRAGAAETDRGKFIESVVAGNLFIIPLDTGGEWFRYHHQFQQLLQHELNRRMALDEIAGLHLRASEWFESQGLIEEAILHALKAKDEVRAAEIIERHYQVELNKELWHVVARWLAMLPLEVIQQRPRLLLAHAWGLFHHYQMQEIPLLLQRAESLLVDESADKTLLGEVNFFRGFILTLIQGDPEGALIQFEAARKRLSMSKYSFRELEVLDSVAHQMAGKGALAIQLLDQKIHAMSSGKDPLFSRLLAAQVFSHLLSGNLVAAARAAQRFTVACKKTGEIANAEAWSRYLRANADLQSYHLDEALQGFQYAAQKRDIVHRKAAIEAQVGLVLTCQALQSSEDAVDAMKHLMAFALETDEPEHIVVTQSCQARLSLLQGDSKPAIDWARSFDLEAHAPSMLMWLEIPVITQLRVLVATGTHESLQQASELLVTLRQSAEAVHNTYQAIDLLVLQSLALGKLGRADEALEVLQQAVKLAEPGSWIRPFVELGRPMAELLERLADQNGVTDYLHLVLDKFPAHEQHPAGTAAGESRAITGSEVWLSEPLTRRESDVLELLVQRLQTKEIAARLFVSPETVKSHLKNLYQKLDVNNRREAAIKAAEIVSRRRDASHTLGPRKI
jgi:LuxR family maltose regulon positive regulatory protein